MKTTQNLMLKTLGVMPVPKDKIKCKKYTKNLSINIWNNFTGFHFFDCLSNRTFKEQSWIQNSGEAKREVTLLFSQESTLAIHT